MKPLENSLALRLALLVGAHCLLSGATAQPLPRPNILDLQPFKQVISIAIGNKETPGTAKLINLNPQINVWHLLELQWEGREPVFYHLENPAPQHQTLNLDRSTGRGLSIETSGDEAFPCELWSAESPSAILMAERVGTAFAPLCDGRLYLRNRTAGYRTKRELVAEFLRDRVWGGEKLIGLVKDHLLQDAHLERAAPRTGGADDDSAPSGGPMPARSNSGEAGLRPLPAGLGIDIELPVPGAVAFGAWYPAVLAPDIYVSLMQANLIDPAIFETHTARVRALDNVESSAIVYLIAFDLDRFDLGYQVGTDHPRLGWSQRSLPQMRAPGTAGPDGIDSTAPLVANGIVNPIHVSRTVAAFTGGFKRSHGAFRYGELALRNRGSHYGWMQYGVVFSSLQPDLATIFVLDDGTIDLKTWQASDQHLLPRIKHARQNGVPLIEMDAEGTAVPGALVSNRSAGNWSGAADGQQRTVRAGACLQEPEGERFLIYAYFSSVTPPAMARVFQSYDCRYAMLLDMNALEHTYLAIYGVTDSGVLVQHLVRGMEEVDKTVSDQIVPRFIGYPDNRDFFYVMRREDIEP